MKFIFEEREDYEPSNFYKFEGTEKEALVVLKKLRKTQFCGRFSYKTLDDFYNQWQTAQDELEMRKKMKF